MVVKVDVQAGWNNEPSCLKSLQKASVGRIAGVLRGRVARFKLLIVCSFQSLIN